MILSPLELGIIKPSLLFIGQLQHSNVLTTLINPSGRHVVVDISAAGVLIKATYPDSSPMVEFYRSPMGFAQAYRLPIQAIADGAEQED
jgi:hypothetical protein